jgi:hypothetical protein
VAHIHFAIAQFFRLFSFLPNRRSGLPKNRAEISRYGRSAARCRRSWTAFDLNPPQSETLARRISFRARKISGVRGGPISPVADAGSRRPRAAPAHAGN